MKRHREVTRQQREKNFALSAAIVGYTNAGKSTLLNRLTGAGILAEDKLLPPWTPPPEAIPWRMASRYCLQTPWDLSASFPII